MPVYEIYAARDGSTAVMTAGDNIPICPQIIEDDGRRLPLIASFFAQHYHAARKIRDILLHSRYAIRWRP